MEKPVNTVTVTVLKQKGKNMTLKEWDDVIAKMDKDEAQRMIDALAYLERWPEFKEAFKWTCMFTLRHPLESRVDGYLGSD